MCGFVTVEAQNAPNPPANQSPEARVASNVIEDIEFRGLPRMPWDTLRAMLASRLRNPLRVSAALRILKNDTETRRAVAVVGGAEDPHAGIVDFYDRVEPSCNEGVRSPCQWTSSA